MGPEFESPLGHQKSRMRTRSGFLLFPSSLFPLPFATLFSGFLEGIRNSEEGIGRERGADMNSPLLSKSKAFALEMIKVCNEIKSSKRESVLTNQLIRSGTSIGANIREAFYGHGRADFIAKLQIALKECAESEYWLELLIESGYYDDHSTLERCTELKKLLISSLNTAKKNLT